MSLLSRKLIDSDKIPKSRVNFNQILIKYRILKIKFKFVFQIELRLHLEGAVRYSTLWELAHKKGISLNIVH